MTLRPGDTVVGMGAVDSAKENQAALLVVTAQGFGKQSVLTKYRVQKRGGLGVRATQAGGKIGRLIAAFVVTGKEEVFLASRTGQTIRMNLEAVPVQGRNTRGVRLMRLDEKDEVISVSCALF